MRPLTASDVIKLWEEGEGQPAVDRALTMLAYACPELGDTELAELSIGQRDARLMELRELTFGSRLDGITTCERCQVRLEFNLDLVGFRGRFNSTESHSTVEEFEIEADGCTLRFRSPNSRDLAAVAFCEDVTLARRQLAERCVIQSNRNRDVVAELSEAAITRLAERISEREPEADVMLDFVCPSCGYEWQSVFDIASFFWTEIAAQSRRLLREIHLLASAYGWREVDLLAMSARRRHAYLEMIG